MRGRNFLRNSLQRNTPLPFEPSAPFPNSSTASLRVNPHLDHLYLFNQLPLRAEGQLFHKPSTLHRSRLYHAQLRSFTIVAFRNVARANAKDAGLDDVMAVLPVHKYSFDLARKVDYYSRIYITPRQPSSCQKCLLYIKLLSEDEAKNWTQALAVIKSHPLPSIPDLSVQAVVGSGFSSKVLMVQSSHDEEYYALKVIPKAVIMDSVAAFIHVAAERQIMSMVTPHPFVIPLCFAFQTNTCLYMATPFCAGGDLASYMRAKLEQPCQPSQIVIDSETYKVSPSHLPEWQARLIAAEVILGLEHLHMFDIVYRDLKLENVFIDKSGHIRIGDLGLAKYLDNKGSVDGTMRTTTICGTRTYVAPEMLMGKPYSFEVDLWCLGVMLFRIMTGEYPYQAPRAKDLFEIIKYDKVRIPPWLSPDAQSLLAGLLNKNPSERLTVNTVKKHAFFRGTNWNDVLNLRYEACIPDIHTGADPMDALHNFDLRHVEDVTVGEFTPEANKIIAKNIAQFVALENVVIGFEYVNTPFESVGSPLSISAKSGSLFSKIASIDVDLSPAYQGLIRKRS